MNCDHCPSTTVPALYGGHPTQDGGAWCWECCQFAGIAAVFSRLRLTAAASVIRCGRSTASDVRRRDAPSLRRSWHRKRKTQPNGRNLIAA